MDTHISESIWKQLKIPCPFNFKKSKICKNYLAAKCYCEIQGYCEECSNEIVIVIKDKAEEGSNVELHVRTRDTKGIPHKSVRPPERAKS